MKTDEEIRPRSESTSSRRVLLIGLLATILVTIGITFGPSMLSRYRNWSEGKTARRAEEQLAPYREFYGLTEAAHKGARATDPSAIRSAAVAAQRCLELAPRFVADWNYGNALHYGNLVLGRLALLDGNKSEARQRLLAAGRTPGSPQLGDHGPDMTLAQELLAQGDRDIVTAYLELCNRFWIRKEKNRTHEWIEAVRAGHEPDFGSHSGLPVGAKAESVGGGS